MKLSDNFICVGAAAEEGKEPCVVVIFHGGVTVRIGEADARKLADDILRNANYLWPCEENQNEK